MARPLRSLTESLTSEIPNGPLGFIGGGNAVGAIGFAVVGVANKFTPIGGISVGYNVEGHSIEREDGREVHTFEINAASKDVARFVAKLKSAPSNVDFALRETDVKSVSPIVERRTFNTWRIVVVVKDREEMKGEMEDVDES